MNAPHPQPSPSAPTICVHEHSDALRTALEHSLLQAGFVAIRSVGSLRDLGATLTDGRVDVLLLDLDAPGQNVLDLCRTIRIQYPEMGLLLFSARYGTALSAQCLDAGADQLIPKPVAAEELAAQVRRLVTRSRALSTSRLQPQLAERACDGSPTHF